MPGLLRPLRRALLAYDPYVADEVFAAQGAERVRGMDALLAESDIVSLHARATAETRGFIGEPQFRRMKRGAYFINTARGPMVDYDALYRAGRRPPARGRAGDFRDGAAAARLAAAQAAERHPDAAHRRMLAAVGARRRRDGVRRYRPLVLPDEAPVNCANPIRPIKGAPTLGQMPRNLLLGIDVGTTSLKAVLFDADGTILGAGRPGVPHGLSARGFTGRYPPWSCAEQDPDDWWRAACAVLPKVIVEAGADPRGIAGIGVSGQAPSVVPVRRDGTPLHPALLWLDRRAEDECAWLREHVGAQAIAGINGGRIDPYYLAPKWLWVREHRPDVYRETHVVLQANGYLVHKLCGACCMDVSHGPLTLFFDSRRLCYSADLADRMGIDLAQMPPIRPCAEVVGEVTRTAAAATGLAPGTPVIAGMCDGTAAAVEAGLRQPGEAVEMTGQSTVLLISSDKPYLGDNLIPLVHGVPGQYLVVGALVASGGALRWFRDQLGRPSGWPVRCWASIRSTCSLRKPRAARPGLAA